MYCNNIGRETVKGGMQNGMEWNTEWNGMWNGEMLKKDDRSMLYYSVDIASGLLIPDVTQNSPLKKQISAYSLDWTDLINNSYTMYILITFLASKSASNMMLQAHMISKRQQTSK